VIRFSAVTPGETRLARSSGSDARAVPQVDYRAVFEQLAAPCLLLLPDAPRFSIVAASDTYLALAQTSRAALVGTALLDALPRGGPLVHGAEHDELRASLERALSQCVPTRTRLHGARAASADVTAPRAASAVVNVPVLGEPGEVRYLLTTFERAEALPLGDEQAASSLERELAERTRELAAASAELEAFSYSVAHDLRAPLRAIDGFSQVLAQDYAAVLDADAGDYLERIRAGAQRMSVLLDDMLELSRIQRTPLRKTTLDVSELARRIIDGLRRNSPEREVDVDIAPRLSVHADAHLTTVLLEKLLGNAWKFTSKKPRASIQLGREPSADPTTLFVADDGVGFEMTSAGRLFSPFQRLHRASDFDGTGMGLAIAHRIVSRHGGRIWAEGEVGNGARFRWTVEPGSARDD